MGIYSVIKKEFRFLTSVYGFNECDNQKHGAYFYITWTNSRISIKTLYDCRNKNPVSIFIYDANSLGTIYDIDEYSSEFAVEKGTPRERLHYASKWLKSVIADGIIVV